MSFPLKQFIDQAEKEKKSTEFINACVSYITLLSERKYPVFFSIEHFAKEVNLSSYYLRALIGESFDEFSIRPYKYQRYSYFKLKKRDNSFREIMSPAKELKFIQKWILQNILEFYPLRDSCKGFRKNISIYHNAKVHENSTIILKIDLLKFYDTITENRVFGVFNSMGYLENVSVSLARLTTARHRTSYWDSFDQISKETLCQFVIKKPAVLPQGSPSSPMLANIIASRMDRRFEALADKLSFNYSRYADDLTFSITTSGKLPALELIKSIISDEGFYVNEKKIKYMKRGCKQYVTGLTTTNGVNVSKKYRKEISEHIYYCRKFGVMEHLKARCEDFEKYNSIKFHDWLYGHICFIKSINQKVSLRLLEDFKKINWFI